MSTIDLIKNCTVLTATNAFIELGNCEETPYAYSVVIYFLRFVTCAYFDRGVEGDVQSWRLGVIESTGN